MKRCEIEFTKNGTAFRGISSNFSLSGLFIKTSKPIAEDTLIELIVHLPNGLTSELKGIVRRAFRSHVSTQKNGMGIELTERDSNYLDFLSSLLPDGDTNKDEGNLSHEHDPSIIVL